MEPPQEVRVRDWAAQADRLYTALAAGDEPLARQDFARMAAGTSLTGLCNRVIAPALGRIGTGWAAGQVSIAEEHRATAICERLIAARVHQPQGRPRGIAVTTTPPGERHALPSHDGGGLPPRGPLERSPPGRGPADDRGHRPRRRYRGQPRRPVVGHRRRRPEAGREAREIRERLPQVRVLAGRPGDTLSRLRELARTPGS